MAITGIDLALFTAMRDQNAVTLGEDLLELGQANWFGDVDPTVIAEVIDRYAEPAQRESMKARLTEVTARQARDMIFDHARLFWEAIFHPRSMTAIDFHSPQYALRIDLNQPFDLGQKFGCVMNLGTGEHIFDLARMFRSIHEHTAPGGMMIHTMPFTGFLDHGFYNVNPTFYWDLAAANNYAVNLVAYTELNPVKIVQIRDREAAHALAAQGTFGANSLLYAFYRKPVEEHPFKVPMQGYYAGSISAAANSAWKENRF